MIIKVVTLTGDERMIDVEPSDKVLTLKEKLEEREGIPPQQQRLIFQGKQMKDDKTINSYKLKAGTVLHLVVALRDTIYKLWLHQRYENLALTPEIINLLETLRKKYQIALITNGTSAAQWEKIDKLDIREYFDLILVSGDLPYEKPDKNIFFQACEYLNVHPKDCLMVGDKLETDIQGGLEAGLAGTVWIPLTSGYNLVKSDPQPDYIIKHVNELKKVLNGNEDSRWFFDQKPKNLKQFSRVFYLEEDSNSNASDGS